MRECLFRGKRIDNYDCEWVEGCLIVIPVDENEKDYQCYIITEIDFRDTVYDVHRYAYEVDPNTVCRFTYLFDKNGKRIFEDDILEYRSYTGTGLEEVNRAVVFWDEHRWSYKRFYSNRWTESWNNKSYECDIYKNVVEKYGEVIGNIYDNSELIV